MGLTIHFEGRLPNEKSFRELIAAATSFARRNGWAMETIKADKVTLQRVKNEELWHYVGPVRGLAIFPHEDSEPVRLEFDKDLYIQEYTKTQFAGTEVHKQVVSLLRLISVFFSQITVEDEAEFWETTDEKLLESNFRSFFGALADELSKYPDAQVKVKTPEGRIIDMLT